MEIIDKLKLKIGGEEKILNFGIPNDSSELEGMFRLRYHVYTAKGYIESELFPDGLEKDVYDKDSKCIYFIAKIESKIIGTVRLIVDEFLPTEKDCYKFEEPQAMKEIPRKQRAELSRLISIPYDELNKQYIPRNLVTLFLLDCIIKIGQKRNLIGGYSFIKAKLNEKLKKIKIPIHIIEPYSCICAKENILYRYFNQPENPVIPIFYLREEVKKRLDEILNDERMFVKTADNMFVLKESFYNRFLRFLKII